MQPDAIVKSLNFEFLRPKYDELASLGGFAEKYAYPDPQAALGKLRSFVERAVEIIFSEGRLTRTFNANLNDLLQDTTFRRIVPTVVQTKFHFVRKVGNDALHNNRAQTSEALRALRETFELAQWLHLAIAGGQSSAHPTFRPPSPTVPPDAGAERLEKEKKDIQQKLAAQEAQMKQLLVDLDAERQKREAAEKLGLRARQQFEQTIAKAASKAASVLEFDELQTRRRYVDEGLLAAGWPVGADGKSTELVGQEVPVKGLSNKTGEGFVDYVLWADNGKPLAVIEVKRAASEMEKGREQARLYADGLEKQYGTRPLIFYTNGIDIGLWDDFQRLPPRDVSGFYSKDSLEHLTFQRQYKVPLATVSPRPEIAGRMYQLEAIKRVCERFTDGHRKALVVQATGTGKTRVAISLCDVLLQAKWAKRILFLCDRKELRKQANNVFNEFLPGEPRIIVSGGMTQSDRTKNRIFLATYPAMMSCYTQFDVGFFDLIIADESHRSIYNKYRDLFIYFDALQLGLTATPIEEIDRNTYGLFGCEDQNPTANFSFKEAIEHRPPYLVNFRVLRHTTHFLREGIRYSQMTPEQRAQLEEEQDNPHLVEFDAEKVDKQIFNDDTTRQIWANLMEYGIRDASGMHPGKTIVFARNHDHARHLETVFQKTYPQYGGTFCRLIDNQEPKADQLMDDLKQKENDLTVAISVDMLDTGLDVPEIVNLVFAKPVRSRVKFRQMIGRGTRLCPNLFGPGRHKTEFLIIDHWGNFEFFDMDRDEKNPSAARSLMQNLFEARIELGQAALDAMDETAFQKVVDLLLDDVRALDRTQSFAVKEQWQAIEKLKNRDLVASFSAATKADLLTICSPLMKQRNIRGDEDAYRFDHVIAVLETELLRKGPRFADYKARVEESVELLQKNLSPVKAKREAIARVRDKAFWAQAKFGDMEALRVDLRTVMRHQAETKYPSVEPMYVDISDSGTLRDQSYVPRFDETQMAAYRKRVEDVIASHFAEHPVLLKVRRNQRVTDEELATISKLILGVDDHANLRHLAANSPETRNSLLYTLRGIVGLEAKTVNDAFEGFAQRHRHLSSRQLQFLALLKNLIIKNGGLEIDRLYDDPFTTLHPAGLDGVFTEPEYRDELATIIAKFTPVPDSQRERAS
jgi:type I restriction enzyme R subunit